MCIMYNQWCEALLLMSTSTGTKQLFFLNFLQQSHPTAPLKLLRGEKDPLIFDAPVPNVSTLRGDAGPPAAVRGVVSPPARRCSACLLVFPTDLIERRDPLDTMEPC